MSLNERVLEAVGRHWPVTGKVRWVVLAFTEDFLRTQLELARTLINEVLE